jgi:hypothetical protein
MIGLQTLVFQKLRKMPLIVCSSILDCVIPEAHRDLNARCVLRALPFGCITQARLILLQYRTLHQSNDVMQYWGLCGTPFGRNIKPSTAPQMAVSVFLCKQAAMAGDIDEREFQTQSAYSIKPRTE